MIHARTHINSKQKKQKNKREPTTTTAAAETSKQATQGRGNESASERASEREEKKVKHFLGVNYNVHCE